MQDWAHARGLRELQPSILEILQRTGPLLCPGSFSLKKIKSRSKDLAGSAGPVRDFTEEMFRRCTHRGTEARLALALSGRPDVWPIRALPTESFQWTVELSFPMTPATINVQELRVVLASMKWRARSQESVSHRFIHLVDSQVSLLALAKGRSSSAALTYVLRRISAVVLGLDMWPLYCYCTSADNPADGPSRWCA